jgi:hypothetical protein
MATEPSFITDIAKFIRSDLKTPHFEVTSLALARLLTRDLLALVLVRWPVRKLALLATVPRFLACRALPEPDAAAAGARAVRLGIEVRGLMGWGSIPLRDDRCCAVIRMGLRVSAVFD